jgi:hypothetical protein
MGIIDEIAVAGDWKTHYARVYNMANRHNSIGVPVYFLPLNFKGHIEIFFPHNRSRKTTRRVIHDDNNTTSARYSNNIMMYTVRILAI